jgi:two-component system cell cycle sensor histidine kinase/response regulator CckA
MISMTQAEFERIWEDLQRHRRADLRIRRCGTTAPIAGEHPRPRETSLPLVLVVDDDDDVREFAAIVLHEAGYRVMEASGGAEALLLLGEVPHIDLMFTDIVMPKIDGFTLARLAKREHPNLNVLYATGYADQLRAPVERYGRVLQKPYRSAQLEAAVRETSDQ